LRPSTPNENLENFVLVWYVVNIVHFYTFDIIAKNPKYVESSVKTCFVTKYMSDFYRVTF